MAVYRNWKSLEKGIVDRVQEATKDCSDWALNRLEENLARFYETDEPILYVRTGHLGESGKQFPHRNTLAGAVGGVYIDERPFYTTGTYETPWVFENAEIGYPPSHMLGNPFFWEDTMIDIENDLMPRSFGRFFRKV